MRILPPPSSTIMGDEPGPLITLGSNESSDTSDGSNVSNSRLPYLPAVIFGIGLTFVGIVVAVKHRTGNGPRNRRERRAENVSNLRGRTLLSANEINTKFPSMKYEEWVVRRVREGLPSTGGVPKLGRTVRSSMSDAVENPTVESRSRRLLIAPEIGTTPSTVRGSQCDGAPSTSSHQPIQNASSRNHSKQHLLNAGQSHGEVYHGAAIASGQSSATVDACAVCLDTFKDEDSIRGLTCGHAFHAKCIDPWLTSRRACCPLCKAACDAPTHIDASIDMRSSHVRHDTRFNLPRLTQATKRLLAFLSQSASKAADEPSVQVEFARSVKAGTAAGGAPRVSDVVTGASGGPSGCLHACPAEAAVWRKQAWMQQLPVRSGDEGNGLVWRGTASGGRNKENNWCHFHRHRWVQMMNGTTISALERGDKSRGPTFDLPQVPDHLQGRLGDWLASFSDVAFVNLECYPSEKQKVGIWPFVHTETSRTCPYTSPFMAVKGQHAHEEAIRGHLRRMDYFLTHDDAAERIALEGQRGAEQAYRREDMKLYVWRPLLEYARVVDDERDRLAYVLDIDKTGD
ncbi:hypothetical protein Purlil1_13434 [Purpureocillium lilacinum]|uniref:RING-type domain-containing protein n=1 Tax=Purpureocillium lilacinum TaxID=33203 RepID=A0ABR0BE43_PURLI|nr:hypothetical protein Purlil1_13434 [Purpureocillium lilacinum]